MNSIYIKDILPIDNLKEYKLHLGCWNGHNQPLDLFVSDFKIWKAWNEWKGTKNEFNRKYIFSVIDYYHEPDKWLFGGIWEVKKRHLEKSREGGGYEIELVPEYQNLIGRLVLKHKTDRRNNMYLHSMESRKHKNVYKSSEIKRTKD